MEEPYKSRIQNNIFDLSQITEASSALLIYLQQEGALVQHDVEVINSISLPIDKTYKLYEILLRDPGSAQPLIDGLRKTHQLGAVEILETATTPPVSIPVPRTISSATFFSEATPPPFSTQTDASPPQRQPQTPYPVHIAFPDIPQGEASPHIYMPLPTTFDFTCPPPSPAVPKMGGWSPNLQSLSDQLHQLESESSSNPEPKLDDLHKYLLRSHSKGQPLILIQPKPKSDPGNLSKYSQNYTQAYHHHYDHNVLWIDAKSRQRLEETFLNIVRNFRVNIDFSPHVGFGFHMDNSNCCAGVHGSELDLKVASNQIFKHFLGRKCLIIFENVEKDDPLLASVLPPNPAPPGFPTILLISPTSEKNEAWGTDANVVELTEEGKIVKKSWYLGKVVGSLFQVVLGTYNKAKSGYNEMDGISGLITQNF